MIDSDEVDHSQATNGPLLPGEIADSDLPDDAEHWAAVYEELTGFLVQLDPPDDAAERYWRRLAHWRGRRDELGAGDSNGRAPGRSTLK